MGIQMTSIMILFFKKSFNIFETKVYEIVKIFLITILLEKLEKIVDYLRFQIILVYVLVLTVMNTLKKAFTGSHNTF